MKGYQIAFNKRNSSRIILHRFTERFVLIKKEESGSRTLRFLRSLTDRILGFVTFA